MPRRASTVKRILGLPSPPLLNGYTCYVLAGNGRHGMSLQKHQSRVPIVMGFGFFGENKHWCWQHRYL